MFKNEEEIKTDMLNTIPSTFDKSQNSFLHDAIAGTALEMASLYMALEFMSKKLDIENLEGEELNRFIYQRTGLKRKSATYATTEVTIRGEEGTVIERGELVTSGNINFEIVESKQIDVNGIAQVVVKASEAGSIANVPKGAIDSFPVTINGIVSVANKESVTNGYDVESDQEYLSRYYERIRTPATSGNKYHYMIWAKEVPGVGDAKVTPLWAGDNTVKITIIDSNKQPANIELVNEVQNYIDPNISGTGEGVAPIGAFATVESALSKAVNLSFGLTFESSYERSEVVGSIQREVAEYFKEIAFAEKIISYAKIGSSILSAEGVVDYKNLLVNQNTQNIELTEFEVPIVGEVVIND